MKKMLVAAIAATMTVGAFAECGEIVNGCVAWDFKLNLKSLGPKKLNCKGVKDSCGETIVGDSKLYYLDNLSRKLNGFLWACDYECDAADLNVVLWDKKNKVGIITLWDNGTAFQTIEGNFDTFAVYGKKANKVFAQFELVGSDANGVDAIEMNLAGLNGKILKTNWETCTVKSISGNAAGSILIPARYNKAVVDYTYSTGLCGEEVEVFSCEDDEPMDVLYTTLCEVCCGFNGWCVAAEEGNVETVSSEDMVPAYGTWSMKYNKKMSNSRFGIASYVPAYAF